MNAIQMIIDEADIRSANCGRRSPTEDKIVEFGSKLMELVNEFQTMVTVQLPSASAGADAQQILLKPKIIDDARLERLENLRMFAQALYRMRRNRMKYFDEDLFGEPAWDMLLDLFAARCLGKKISVTSACLAGSVPATTGLRWITNLMDRGFIKREEDEADKRRAFVVITEKGMNAMIACLEAAIVR